METEEFQVSKRTSLRKAYRLMLDRLRELKEQGVDVHRGPLYSALDDKGKAQQPKQIGYILFLYNGT